MLGILQKKNGWPLKQALRWLEERYDEIVREFLETRDSMPSFGPAFDAELREYIDGMAVWVRANDSWSFEGERYFGPEGRSIQQHRVVTLLPPTGAGAPPL